MSARLSWRKRQVRNAIEMETGEQLRIVIRLAPRLARFAVPDSSEQQLLHESLQYFVDQLAGDLALPVQPLLQLVSASVEADANDFSVSIDGQACRLPLPTKVPDETSAREMAGLIAAGIHENRELFLTDSLAEKLFQEWLPRNHDSNGAPELSSAEFQRLLLGLIERGFRVDRIKGRQTSAAGAAALQVEENVAEAVALKLYLSKPQASIPSFNLNGAAAPEAGDESILELTRLMQDGLFYELGIVLPNLTVEIDERLEGNEFQVQVNDLRQPPLRGLDRDQLLVNDTLENLAKLNVPGEKAAHPTSGAECTLARGDEAAGICRQANLTTWGPAGFVILNMSRTIRRHAGAFLTRDVVEFLLGQLGQVFPALGKAALARYDLSALAAILRDLLDEEISVRDLRAILEGLLAISGATTADLSRYIVFFPYTLNLCQLSAGTESPALKTENYSNYVRTFLKRYISHKYTRGQSSLLVYLIDPEIEARLNQTETQPLNPEEHRQLINGVLNEAHYSPMSNPVILTSIETRRLLRKFVEREFPWLAVLSYQELSPELNIQPLARISWDLRSATSA